MRLIFLWLCFSCYDLFAAEITGFRSERRVFLNGIEISGATGQLLKDVDVNISSEGDIFITGEHYKVFHEERYVPIRNVREASGGISHQKPRQFVPSQAGKQELWKNQVVDTQRESAEEGPDAPAGELTPETQVPMPAQGVEASASPGQKSPETQGTPALPADPQNPAQTP